MRKIINSKENRIYKECRKLSQKKYRDKEGIYIIEGYNLIREALLNGADIDFIIEDDLKTPEKATYQRENIDYSKIEDRVYAMEHSLFSNVCQTETSQGIMGVVRKKEYSRNDIEKLLGDGANIVVLDRLQDPGNIGTIIRTAEGANYKAVLALKGTADVYSPKTVRAAAGSVFRIPIIQVQDNRELVELVKCLGKTLVTTAMNGDSNYYECNLYKDIALVVGNEGNGVSPELIELSDIKVKLPMAGKLESLNASVAAGILMYEAVRGEALNKN